MTAMQQPGETVNEAAKRWTYRVLRANLIARGLPPTDREMGFENWLRMAEVNCPLPFYAFMDAVNEVVAERTGRRSA
jgi:hypothetical protein